MRIAVKYIIWGVGERLEKNKQQIKQSDVVCFIDKNKGGAEARYWEKPIITPEEIDRYEYDFVVISTNKYFDEIAKECIFKRGIDCHRILAFEQLLETKRICVERLSKYRDVLNYFEGINKHTVQNWLEKIDGRTEDIDSLVNYRGFLFSTGMSQISLCMYQVTHKVFQPIGNDKYVVIGVGERNLPYKMDNTEDNIASYNAIINEGTALYWIWKQGREKYIGLNHYRRVFESELNHSWPVQAVEVALLLEKYDVIAAEPVVFSEYTVAEMLKKEICEEAFEASWNIISVIFENKAGKEKRAFKRIINGNFIFPCNMFVMSREKLNEYCSWLFPILFVMIRDVQIKEEWDDYSKRVIGFWAERLFTVWLYYSNYTVKTLHILTIGDNTPYGKI